MEPPPPRLVSSLSLQTPQMQYHPRSSASIFVHALHLLDLDQLRSYPNITLSTYTNSNKSTSQNAQARLKATEWALYHLFRLYSPSETTSRLSPHFPPTSPLQSKNLRTGLYNWITELKVNGVLPREIVLRKTTLDECKGEKFEELLARFAMVVVRKTLKDGNRSGNSFVGSEKHVDEDDLVPLILAHRVSLNRTLQRRQDLSLKAATYSAQLARSRKDIELGLDEIRSHEIRSQSPSRGEGSKALSEKDHEMLQDQVHLAFASDRRWAKYLFEGTPDPTLSTTSGLNMPDLPFDDLPATDSEIDSQPKVVAVDIQQDPNQPMSQLQSTIVQNQTRLQRLMQLRDSTLANIKVDSEKMKSMSKTYIGTTDIDQTLMTTSRRDASPTNPVPRFSRHPSLRLTA